MREQDGQPPRSLGELIDYIMDTRGYRSLAELQRHTSIKYQTLWAWQNHSRGMIRPPTAAVLRTIATDFGLPEELVFRAAGRTHSEVTLDPGEMEFAHLWKELSPGDKLAVEQLMRHLLGTQKVHEPE